jgi:hypothetical protein
MPVVNKYTDRELFSFAAVKIYAFCQKFLLTLHDYISGCGRDKLKIFLLLSLLVSPLSK